MDIKPLSTQTILPATGTPARDRAAESFPTPDSRVHTPAPETAPPAQDPGARRIGSDPWGSAPVGDRLLMAGADTANTPEGIGTMSLPDAVRTAVEFVFDPAT